jgi:ubiquinone/menaquinone biosynthesis C-methylase UbiE
MVHTSDQTKGHDGWSPSAYNKSASFVYSSTFTNKVLTWLNPQPGERIIDFGCGTGELTLELTKFVGESGYVVGFDYSSNMVCSSLAEG